MTNWHVFVWISYFIHSFTHLFIRSPIHSFIHPPHSSIHSSRWKSHHFVHHISLSIYPSFHLFFSYALIIHNPRSPPPPPLPHFHWLIFYLFFFFPPKFMQTRRHPEFVLCHWYSWILQVSWQWGNLPWPVLHLNERWRLAFWAKHYRRHAMRADSTGILLEMKQSVGRLTKSTKSFSRCK